MPQNCPQYKQLLQSWKEKLNEIDKLYQNFKLSGNQETKQKIEELKIEVQQIEKEYQDFTNEIVEFDGKNIKRIDVDLFKKIEALTNNRLEFETENQDVLIIRITKSEVQKNEIDQALALVKYFNSLQRLYCYDNPNLETLPELPDSLQELYCSDNPNLETLPELPDSLEMLDCSNTLASQNPETIQQLKEFKAKHPGVVILGVNLD